MTSSAAVPAANLETVRLAKLAPRPTAIADLGLSTEMLITLACKHFVAVGVLATTDLMQRLAVAGPIVENLLHTMRKQALIEVRAKPSHDSELRFGLTERGRVEALDAMARDGYVGAAPIPLQTYAGLVRRQSVHACHITRSSMRAAFADVVIGDEKLDQLGPALNSGRAIFLYGEAGSGKTFVARCLANALRDPVLVPHAVYAQDTVIQLFDPVAHRALRTCDEQSPLLLEHGFDPRYVLCQRPLVVAGGELSVEMLEVQFDGATRTAKASVQLKANNGLLLIDDLGRQRISCEALFNRWILPMEEQQDCLTTSHGQHFPVPFDVVLVFSTNLDPHKLADDAFLRRIGYKVAFGPISRDEYRRIWEGVCFDKGLQPDPSLVSWLMDELHEKAGIPLLPCHPRDLLGMALDLGAYQGLGRTVDEHSLRWAWRNYFLRAPQLNTLTKVI